MTFAELANIDKMPHVKFLFARDPYERLISAWADKLISDVTQPTWQVSFFYLPICFPFKIKIHPPFLANISLFFFQEISKSCD